MDQRRINRGSTWINVDQVPSACPLQHVAAVLTHGSCVMRPTHVSCIESIQRPTLQRPDSWLMRHVSCVMRPFSVPRFRRQASGSWLMAHGSWLMRHASGSWLMRPTHVACVMRQAHASHSRGMRHASCVRLMRPTHVACVRLHVPHSASFSRRPLPVMTTTKRRHFPMLLLLDLRPLRCMAWGNRVVLPTPYSAMGTNKNSGRRFQERRPLFLLIRKRPA